MAHFDAFGLWALTYRNQDHGLARQPDTRQHDRAGDTVRASKRGGKIGWQERRLDPEDQGETILVPAFTRLFKHSTTRIKIDGEEITATAWVDAGADDAIDVAEASKQRKRRGNKDKKFGPYEVVKYMPPHRAMTLN